MSDSSSERDPVEELAEEFLARFRRGERPAVSEYARRYPEVGEQIPDVLRALVLMEELGLVSADTNGDRRAVH